MAYIEKYYPEFRFGGFTSADGTLAFYLRVVALIRADSVVVDVGCGRGAASGDPIAIRRNLRNMRGRCARVIGIDVDADAMRNSFVDEFRKIEGPKWPVVDSSVDVSIVDSVLEHIADPEAFFSELERVTRPTGIVCIRTPNVASYFGVAARLIPNKFHSRVLSRVQDGRPEQDVFPTLYRCNTHTRLRRILERHGFDSCVYGHDSEPRYLLFSRAAYAMGVWHQKLAPQRLKTSLFAFGRRRVASQNR